VADDIRVGLIGFGHGGAVFHAPLIAATPGLRLAGIMTSSHERRALAARSYPGVRLVAEPDSLLAGPDRADLLVVSSPNRTHVPLALAGLEAGLAVVVDKPLAPGVAAARRLIDAARRHGRLLTVFHNRRWDGDFLTARRLIAEGRLGDVWRFESRFERWRPVPRENWRERGEPDEAGGVLFDLGSHLIDQALALFGPVRHVFAELDRRRAGVEVDDDAFLALEHESGVRSHLWVSLTAASGGPRLRILGSRAAYVKHGLDVQEDALKAGNRPDAGNWGAEPASAWGELHTGDESARVPTEPGAYPRFYAGVVSALRDGTTAPVPPEDAIAGLEIIEAARRSCWRDTRRD
jgi:predicted dehydrogenase